MQSTEAIMEQCSGQYHCLSNKYTDPVRRCLGVTYSRRNVAMEIAYVAVAGLMQAVFVRGWQLSHRLCVNTHTYPMDV